MNTKQMKFLGMGLCIFGEDNLVMGSLLSDGSSRPMFIPMNPKSFPFRAIAVNTDWAEHCGKHGRIVKFYRNGR